ncbi:uncharacterized protein LOC115628350 [Scaptodrosophila lebanonensis]|uniref:Uncharacterized protein LOC115628350 n=1 Tax=Drosophila lebanonensis TaxID=7225 RepID=A0A6J2TYS0_DROLE|nr:uncharacterized protein LOC115628350 [Scaptodrosophila lebanonensis]
MALKEINLKLWTASVVFILTIVQVSLQLNLAQPVEFAHFLSRIGRVHKLQSINIVYGRGAISNFYLDALFDDLVRNASNSFYSRPIVTGTEQLQTCFREITHEHTLFVIFATDPRDPVLNVMAHRARGRRYCKTIFLLNSVRNKTELKQFFNYLWLEQFRTALVVVAFKRLYHMDPYPVVQIMKLSDSHSLRGLFPVTSRSDFRGYQLQVPVQVDVPSTFWSQDPRSGAWLLDGCGGMLFRELMRHLNVSLHLYPFIVNGSNNLNMHALVNLIVEQGAEISPHLFTTLEVCPLIEYSYPYKAVPRCFMLPLHNEVPRSLYVFLPFKPVVWACILLIILCVHCAARCFWRSGKEKRQFWALLGLSGSQKLVSKSPNFLAFLSRYLACATLVFGAFVTAQLYITKLTSFLAVTLTHNPIGTLEELFSMPYPILTVRSEVNAIIDSLGHAQLFNRQFEYVDHDQFYERRVEMITNYIYPISTPRWSFVAQQQRYLTHKRFWLSNLCYGTFPQQYQLRYDSHFKEPLHRFVLHIHEAGIYDYWTTSLYLRAKQMGYVHDFANVEQFEQQNGVRPLSLNLFGPALYFYLFGMAASLCSFLVEHGLVCRLRISPCAP